MTPENTTRQHNGGKQMADSAFKNMTRHSRLKVGTFVVEFNTPGIGQILKASGCDFAFVDMEHSGFTIGDIKQILRYMQAADLPVIVRPPSKEYHHAARVLDIGASAVMFPMDRLVGRSKALAQLYQISTQGRAWRGATNSP